MVKDQALLQGMETLDTGVARPMNLLGWSLERLDLAQFSYSLGANGLAVGPDLARLDRTLREQHRVPESQL